MKHAFLILAGILFLAGTAPSQATPENDLAALIALRDEDMAVRYPSLALTRGDRRFLDTYEDTLSADFLTLGEELNASYSDRLAAIPRDALERQVQLSYDILSWELESERMSLEGGIAALKQMLPLDPIGGAHLGFATELRWIGTYPFQSEDDYRRMIARMGGFSRWVDDAIIRMRDGIAEGVALPRDVVTGLVAQVEPLAADPEESGFLEAAHNLPANIPGEARARLAADYEQAVMEHVVGAFERLRNFLIEEYLPAARVEAGLWAMPGGRALYLHELRRHTTLEATPEELQRLGMEEVARIEDEMARLTSGMGFAGSQAQFRDMLGDDPALAFADGAAMKAEFERLYAQATRGLPELFETLPDTPLEFHLSGGPALPLSAAAHYVMPSGDGLRAGMVSLNTNDRGARSLYLADALQLHEGVPGHHLALSLQVGNAALPDFRRYGSYSAFHEGWAHYAEALGGELGLYTDPYRDYGRLAFAAWRASRLVVDTGIHWFGWSRADGIRYLLVHTHLGEAEAAAEVDRYIAIPAQALSYKTGERAFLDWRARAESALGERFDIRRFHDAVLADGGMPLSVFEEKMTRWLAGELAR